MRITRDAIFRSALKNLRGNLDAVRYAETEAATGRRIQRPSDEPLQTASILNIESRLRLAARHLKAANLAATRQSAEEAILSSTTDLVRQARQHGRTALDTTDPDARRNAAATIRLIRSQVIDLGNTKVGDEYILSGTREEPAFDESGVYRGDSTPREIEVGANLRLPVNHTGDQVLSGVIAGLDNLARAVESGTPDEVKSALNALDSGKTNLDRAAGELGSWQRQFNEMVQHLDRESGSLKTEEGGLLNADPTESLLKLQEASTSLEAVVDSISKILSTSLIQFLR